jgi:hypothetical protein
MNNVFPIGRPIPAIIEVAEEHDRKEYLALYNKTDGAARDEAQWLLDHPTYSAPAVARWAGCGETRIKELRRWAAGGFMGNLTSVRSNRRPGADEALKTNEDFEDDPSDSSDDVEDPAVVLSNVLDSIKNAKSVAEAYRKIFKVSSFDREAKEKIYNAIQLLIAKWRTVQSTLDRKGKGNDQS